MIWKVVAEANHYVRCIFEEVAISPFQSSDCLGVDLLLNLLSLFVCHFLIDFYFQ